MTTEHKRQYQRVDFAANWFALNPVLALGELGVEKESLRVKVGDGATPWNGLSFIEGLKAANNLSDVSNPATALANLGGAQIVTPEQHGAVGDGVADDYNAIQAAINTAQTAGGVVYFRPVTYKHGTGLVVTGSNVKLVGSGIGTVLSYTGGGTALTIGSKTAAGSISGGIVSDLSLAGTSAAAVALWAIGCRFSRFERLYISGFTGAASVGVLFDTQSSAGGSLTSLNNTILGVYVTGAAVGFRFTKDASLAVTYGANFNTIIGCKAAAFTTYGCDVDFGEFNTFLGCDFSTTQNGAVGLRINDSVCCCFGVRTDCSYGAGNTNIGIQITDTGTDYCILNQVGDGCTTMIQYPPSDKTGLIVRQTRTEWCGDVSRSQLNTTAHAWTRAWQNASASTISLWDIAYIDSSCTQGQVKRCDTTAGRRNLMVCTSQSVAQNAQGQFAERGSTVTVNVDAGAVAVGDTLVQSTTANACAMTNNTVTDPALIVGVAQTAKSAGSNGTVLAYIR